MIEELEKTVSSCCFAPVSGIKGMPGMTCTACEEPCQLTWPPCPLNICDGSGEVPVYAYDSDSHNHYQDGTEKCLHLTDNS